MIEISHQAEPINSGEKNTYLYKQCAFDFNNISYFFPSLGISDVYYHPNFLIGNE